MFVIITDGLENARREFQVKKVCAVIEKRRRWAGSFLILGANIDAVKTGARFGIDVDCAVTYCLDAAGTELSYTVINETVSCMHRNMDIEANWKMRMEEDLLRRKE